MSSVDNASPTQPSAQEQPEGIFLRKASGVMRSVSARDGLFFGYLTAAGLYVLVLTVLLQATLFPKANVLAANLIAIALIPSLYATYSVLTTGMPRSGGDYVYQSRLLHPSIGFMIAWSASIFWAFWWTWLAASAIVTGAISPMLSAIGVETGNAGWTSAADTVTQDYVRIPIMVGLIVLTTWIMSRGMRPYLRIQKYYMIPASVVGLAIILVSYFAYPRSTFMQHFDTFQSKVDGLASSVIVQKAHELGMTAGHSATWDTLGVIVILTSYYMWTVYPAMIGGEIKKAGVLKSTFWMYTGAGLCLFATYMIGSWGLYQYLGQDWLQSFAWLALNNPDVLGGSWDFRGVATLFYIPSLNVFIGILFFVCVAGPMAQSLFNPNLATSRIWLAMSMDRLMPSWLGGVNKHGAPHHAVWLFMFLAFLVGAVFELAVSVAQILFWASIAGMLGICLSAAAGMLFTATSTGRSIYAVSPGAGWRILGIPAVTLFGAIAVFWLGLNLVVYMTHDAFGMLAAGSARIGLIAMLAILVASFLAFWIIRALRHRQGIEVDYAFKTIPRG